MALTHEDFEKIFSITYSEKLIFETPLLERSTRQALKSSPLEHLKIDEEASLHYCKYLHTSPGFNYDIRFISKEVGYGVFTQEVIPSGTYLGEYTGMLTSKPSYLSMNGYLFHYPLETLGLDRVTIDAEKIGSLTRFYNHSFNPSSSKHLIFDGKLLHWIFIANKTIKVGEQITYNYGNNYWYLRGLPELF